jgi:hypothetical protein
MSVSEFFCTVLYEQLSFTGMLNGDDKKIEAFDTTGSWYFIFL